MIRGKFQVLVASSLATLALIAFSIIPATMAADTVNGGGSGMRVSPVTTNIIANPGQTTVVRVTVQNVTSSPMNLQVLINDFTASNDESGTPAIILDANKYAPTHSLKRFVEPIANITLQPNEEKTIPVNIDIPKGAAGGGYFGAVRFAPVTTDTSSGKNVTLAASVGSLILVRVSGEVKDDLRLASIEARQNDNPKVIVTSNKNLTAVVRFDNQGNVQEQPFGKIILKKGNKEIASYEVNNVDPRGNVLPDSIRKFSVNLDKVGSIGKYTLVGNFGYGTSGQLISGQTTFYVIPLYLMILIVLLILLVIFLIFGMPRLVKRYNKNVIAKARRR